MGYADGSSCCDVLFLKDFQTDLKPAYFACSSQSEKNNFKHFKL